MCSGAEGHALNRMGVVSTVIRSYGQTTFLVWGRWSFESNFLDTPAALNRLTGYLGLRPRLLCDAPLALGPACVILLSLGFPTNQREGLYFRLLLSVG